jgi:4-carboxymuconolactone decarboxylase
MTTRRHLREHGEAIRARLFGGGTVNSGAHPDFDDLVVETTYGAIWSRPGLALADRVICTLAALCAVQQLTQLRRYVDAALNIGLPQEAPFTIFAQIGIYAGFAATQSAMDVADSVYRDRGIALPAHPADESSLDALDRRGRELMAKLHGDRRAQGYAAPENRFTSRLYPMTIAYGYGEIWHRPGLDVKQRAMVSLACFTALQLQDQLKKFAQSARNVGLTLDEVCEAIIQTSPYSGYAPALNALRWLSEVLSCPAGRDVNDATLNPLVDDCG